jgi:alpha-amylase
MTRLTTHAARAALPLLALACVDPRPYSEPPAITNHVEDWRDEVIYQLMVDRFANGDVNNDYNVVDNLDALAGYMGGDYQGVIDRVDYLEALGVTAVWVSPIVVNVEEDAGVAGYHGYWTQDFLNVNPHFGDMTTFRQMVEVLHEHDIKVILDIVTNHVGQLFYYDINRNGQPDVTVYGSGDQDSQDGFFSDPIEIVTEWDPAYDPRGVQGWTSLGESGPAPLGWVYMPDINRVPPNPAVFHDDAWYNRRGRVTDWNDLEQVERGDFPGGLKDLATEKPEVRAALIDVFKYWIEQTNIDGYRIDTVKHVEHEFWQEFCPAMRDHCASIGKQQFLMFGEVFDGNDELIGSYTGEEELDSVFNFAHKWQVFDDVFKWSQPTSKIADLYASRDAHYGQTAQIGGLTAPPRDMLVNFMDNHDVPRFLFDQPDPDKLYAALFYLLTMDGIPCIYNGTEQLFFGGNDPANREPLWWSQYDTTGPMFNHIASLSRVRRTYPAMTRGDFTLRWTSTRTGAEEDAHLVAFERSYEGESALVVLNTAGAGTAHTAFEGEQMAVGLDPGTELRVAYPLDDTRSWVVEADGTLVVELGPHEGVLLVPADQVRPVID